MVGDVAHKNMTSFGPARVSLSRGLPADMRHPRSVRRARPINIHLAASPAAPLYWEGFSLAGLPPFGYLEFPAGNSGSLEGFLDGFLRGFACSLPVQIVRPGLPLRLIRLHCEGQRDDNNQHTAASHQPFSHLP